MSEVTSTGDRDEAVPTRAESVWASVGFWLTVFAASVLLASVVLAPRLERVHRLLDELTDLTASCVRLDRQNERLAQFLRALEHDPTLVEQLADWELKGRLPDQMPALLIEPPRTCAPTSNRAPDWWRRTIHILANDAAVERAAYLAVAGLYLIALTFFRSPRSPAQTEGSEREVEEEHGGVIEGDATADIDPGTTSDDEWLFRG